MSSTKIKGDLIVIEMAGNEIAAATNHTLTINAETSESTTKDDYVENQVVWGSETVTKLTWEATTENMVSVLDDNASGKSGYDVLYDAMVTGEPVNLTIKNKGTNNVVKTKYGKAVITNLPLSAPSGDNATFTATFRGVGALSETAPQS